MLLSTLFKLFLTPVIGVFIVEAMVRSGLIPREDYAQRFVAMFLSGTPAAVNQVIVTMLYAKDMQLDTLTVSRLSALSALGGVSLIAVRHTGVLVG